MIIHRAFYREASQATVAIAVVLVAVFLLFGVTSALGRTVRGDYAQSIVAQLIAWQTVRHVDLMLPLGFYLGVLLTLGRWYRDSEMTVLAACGVGLPQLLRPVLLLAAGVALLVAVLAFQLTPYATRAIQELRAESSERPELAGITPGTFSASAADGRILYAEQVAPDGVMAQVFLHNAGDGRPRVILAQTGRAYVEDGRRYAQLRDGWAYEGTPGQADYRVVRFETYTVRLTESAATAPPPTIEALPTRALLATAGAEAAAERHWRLAKPLLVFVLALYAVVLAHTDARRGRMANLFAAILVYFIYSNLLGLGETWILRGQVPPALGLWWVHGLMAGVALYLFHRRSRNRPLWPRLRARTA